MTALCGLMRYGATPDYLPHAVRGLLRACKGRGQDGQDVWIAPEAPVALAARRLQTADLTIDGAQPATARGGTVTVVLDGYIANAAALRHELEAADIPLRGHADAELLAEAAAHWGLNRLLQKLDGAFAFALWDAQDRALHLVRDRMGARPLYLLQNGGVTAFASDAAALATLPEAPKGLEKQAVTAALMLGHVPAPLTVRAGVTALPAGHRLMLRPEDKTPATPEGWWSPAGAVEEAALRGPAPDAAQKLDALRKTLAGEAVTRLDVSFALMDAGERETYALRLAVDRVIDKPYPTLHKPNIDGVMLQTAFDALARLPLPVCDPAAIGWWCALGQSGNQPAPVLLLPADVALPDDAPQTVANPLTRWIERVRTAWPRKTASAIDQYLKRRDLWPQAATMTGTSFTPDWPEPRLEWPAPRRLDYLDTLARLAGGQLPALDMLAGLRDTEIRAPFIDARVLEYGLPRALERTDDWAAWLRGPLRVRAQNLLDDATFKQLGLTNPKPVQAAWTAFLGGDNAQTLRLWTYVTLAAWTKANT